MKPWFPRAATALALVLSAHSAPALTPEEAWAGYQSAATAAGQTVTAESTASAGGTLTATGVTMTVAIPDGPTVATSLATLAFKDRGDGSVEVIYPQSFDTLLTFPDSGPAAPKTMALTFLHDKLTTIASGDAAAPKVDMSAASFTGMVKEVKDAAGKPLDLTGTVSMTDITAAYVIPADPKTGAYDNTFNAGALAITFDVKSPAENLTVNGTLSVGNIASRGKVAAIDPMQWQANLAAALKNGALVDTQVTTGPLALSFKADEGGTQHGFDGTLASTEAHVFLDQSRIDYGFGLLGGTMVARGMEMPFPEVTGNFGEIGLRFTMPVSASDQPQDFSTLVKLVDLTVSEDIWAMVDPGARLRRDPVSFIADLKGTGAWTVDILDPASQIDQGPDLPAKLFTLDLTQLLAKFAGAQIVGVGALTFDNANLQALGGFPAPTGKITFTLTGINALLDAVVAMGIVPEEELMNVRMGLAMFARPGAGPDELVSEVEFQNGALLVNGMPMQ